jgi:tetratricopeptide (TPR) repeat protein
MRVIALGLVLGLAARVSAQPADVSRATELYNTANKELEGGDYDAAARDFLAAFDITKDPVLFFKIGGAYDKAGKCDEAVTYYKRYLAEAKPEPQFVQLTTERITACTAAHSAPASEPTPSTSPTEPGSAAATNPPAAPLQPPSKSKDAAWLFVGSSLAFVTAGAVLAYSASSSEQDLKDLYVSDNGGAPVWNAKTEQRYNDLIDEGHRYQYLSWASFGVAAGCAIGAAIFFWRDAKADDTVSVVPVVSPRQTGIAATLPF